MIPDNIYIILGVPCAGKTMIAGILRKKYKMYYFSGDEAHFSYYKKADPIEHPAMSRKMRDYFELPADFLMRREREVFREQTPMIVSDLVALSAKHERVLFDGIMDLETIAPMVGKNRILYLTVSREIRERDFFNREDHMDMLENIRNNPDLTDEEKERRVLLRKTVAIDSYDYDADKCGVVRFERIDGTTIREMVKFAEKHFGLA